MTERYGVLRVARIRTYVNRLRELILSEGSPEIQAAWEKLEGVVPFLVKDGVDNDFTDNAPKWFKSSTVPEAGQDYLIHANYNGMDTYDVAFYEGRRKDGSQHWVCANVGISVECIMAWMPIARLAEDET